MRLFILTLFFARSFNLSGQDINYQKLLDSAIDIECEFRIVNNAPFDKFELILSDTADYLYNLNNHSYPNCILDRNSLTQIIINSKNRQLNKWTDQELKKAIIIAGKQQLIDTNYIENKFSSLDIEKQKTYLYYARKFNDRDIYYTSTFSYSRPIFDNTKKYALICFDKGYSTKNCMGEWTLYHFYNDKWIRIGNIYNCQM